MTVRDILKDIVGRVVLAREMLADGDQEFAGELLRDLEADIAEMLERIHRIKDAA